MPNLNDHARSLWDRTTQLIASDEAKASFLQQVDKNADGKVTGAEIKAFADDNSDGYLDSQEIEKLGIKATAGDFDRTTIKAMGQAANAMPNLVLFEAEPEKPVAPAEPPKEPVTAPAASESAETSAAPAEASPPAPVEPPPPAIRKWKAGTSLNEIKDSFRTSISFHPDALPSRNLNALTVARPGLFRIQDQVGNSCGTTSLSMVMKYWQGHTLENSVPTIDEHIRAKGKLEIALPGGVKTVDIDGFTSGRDIVDYAKSHGMRAGMKNNATISEMKAYLDKGVPLMCLTDWNFEGGEYTAPTGGKPDGKSLHWISVIGYEYKTDPQTKKQELQLLIGNPHGVVQRVGEADFVRIWSNLHLEIPGGKQIDTGMHRLFVAMVPRDDDAPVTAPNGVVHKAGEISVPTGNDGFKGWVAKKTSEVLQDVSSFQDDLARRGAQIESEMASGYDSGGVIGALKNFWNGDQKELANLRQMAMRGNHDTKAVILKELMEKGINREGIQQLMFDILKETPFGREFDRLVEKLDTGALAKKLGNDQQAGQVLAWIAKSEFDRTGKTGPKFESFASHLAINHRHQAIRGFLANEHVVKNKIVQQIPASLIRDAVRKLTEGITTSASESAIYELLKATSWSQFDQISQRMNMGSLASEMQNDNQLGEIASWSIELGIKTGNWNNVSEILNQLGSVSEFSRADNVIGHALTRDGVKTKLASIPPHLRTRMIDLMDDRTRWRTDEAIKALEALKKIK